MDFRQPHNPAIFLLCLALAACVPAGSAAQDSLSFRTSTSRINITFFYHGTVLSADVTAPENCDIALVLAGNDTSLTLNKKGKVGIFWLNVDEVALHNVPQVYMVYSSNLLATLAPPEVLLQKELGYAALRRHILVENRPVDAETIVQDFIDLKEQSGLYRISNAGFHPEYVRDGYEHFSIRIPIPSAMPPGVYTLTLTSFDNGRPLQEIHKRLVIGKTGILAFITQLAMEHASLYGIMAIVIAIGSGLFIGISFHYINRGRR